MQISNSWVISQYCTFNRRYVLARPRHRGNSTCWEMVSERRDPHRGAALGNYHRAAEEAP